MRNRIIVAGGSGFIGRLLTERLVSGNNDVVVLTRSPGPVAQSIRLVGWDGRTLGEWARELDGARALINLAGRSVNCRTTSATGERFWSRESIRHAFSAR